MHPEARHFVTWISQNLPEYFALKSVVLDIGSADINGNNRELFKGPYTGLDIAPGNNVDIVCKGSEAPFEDEHFDTVITTECLEHDMFYSDTLVKAYALLRPGGLLVMTCATEGRAEHGTPRTTPWDSLTSGLSDSSWSNYYKNLTPSDIMTAFQRDGKPMHELFTDFYFCIHQRSCDLYFAGIKRGGIHPVPALPRYSN